MFITRSFFRTSKPIFGFWNPNMGFDDWNVGFWPVSVWSPNVGFVKTVMCVLENPNMGLCKTHISHFNILQNPHFKTHIWTYYKTHISVINFSKILKCGFCILKSGFWKPGFAFCKTHIWVLKTHIWLLFLVGNSRSGCWNVPISCVTGIWRFGKTHMWVS